MAQTAATRKPTVTNHQLKYIPGVCNIGPAERAKRRQVGIIALVVALVLLVVFIAIGASRNWRWLLILPVSIAASGFLQDALHFCAGFGLKGLYNVVNSVGVTEDVTLKEFRRKDRRKAFLILELSLGIGIVVAGLFVL